MWCTLNRSLELALPCQGFLGTSPSEVSSHSLRMSNVCWGVDSGTSAVPGHSGGDPSAGAKSIVVVKNCSCNYPHFWAKGCYLCLSDETQGTGGGLFSVCSWPGAGTLHLFIHFILFLTEQTFTQSMDQMCSLCVSRVFTHFPHFLSCF